MKNRTKYLIVTDAYLLTTYWTKDRWSFNPQEAARYDSEQHAWAVVRNYRDVSGDRSSCIWLVVA